MSFTSWIRSLKSTLARPRTRQKCRSRRIKPWAEVLEDRTVLSPAGSLDPTYGGFTESDGSRAYGKALSQYSVTDSTRATSMVLQADGKIVAVGWTDGGNGIGWTVGNKVDFAVVRYFPNGTLDSTFGSAGRVTTDVSG